MKKDSTSEWKREATKEVDKGLELSFRASLREKAMQKRMKTKRQDAFQLPKESRFYGERIEVQTGDQSFHPSAFVWRGQRYTITKMIHAWPDWGYGKSTLGKKNWRLRHHRNYFVVRTNTDQLFKIYHDRGVKRNSPKVWILNEELLAAYPRERPSQTRGLLPGEKKRNESPIKTRTDKSFGK